MASGGKRPGAGRPKGGKNRKTVDRERRAVELADKMVKALGVDAFSGNSVALLQLIYKDIRQPMEMRFEAAKAAAPYERPRLASVDHTGEVARDYVARMPMKSANMEDWARQLDQEAVDAPKTLEGWAADVRARGLPKPKPKPKLTNDPPDDGETRQ